MKSSKLLGIVVVLGAAVISPGPTVSRAATGGKAIKWKGYVTDTWCGVNRDNKPPTIECTTHCVQSQHAKYAFYNLADGQVYVLNPQDLAAKYSAQLAIVEGTADDVDVPMKTMRGPREGKTITASAIHPVAPQPEAKSHN